MSLSLFHCLDRSNVLLMKWNEAKLHARMVQLFNNELQRDFERRVPVFRAVPVKFGDGDDTYGLIFSPEREFGENDCDPGAVTDYLTKLITGLNIPSYIHTEVRSAPYHPGHEPETPSGASMAPIPGPKPS